MSLKRNIWLAYMNGIELQYIYVEYMLNYIVRAGDCHMISWLQFVRTFTLLNLHYTSSWR